jgi:protein-tyrosine-phosphatase
MKKIIFVCVGNSGRSQMAEAFAKRLGEGIIEAESAGTRPARKLNESVIEVMSEIGYDLGDQYPKMLTLDMLKSADRVISMGCGVNTEAVCPATLVPTEDWDLEDPERRPIEKVREIRDQIMVKVQELVREIGHE